MAFDERNASVRNTVRFVAHFLSRLDDADEDETHGLRFLPLLEFDVGDANEAFETEDDGVEDVAAGAAA